MQIILKTTDENFQSYLTRPLVAGDKEAYKIEMDSDEPIMVTAKRSDGMVFSGIGSCENGKAAYVLDKKMYDCEGELTLRIAVLNGTALCTVRELYTTVLGTLV